MNYDIELNANDSSVLETQYVFTQGDYGQIQFSIRVKVNGAYVTNAQRAYIVFTLPNGYVVTGADMSKSVATYTYPFQGNELQVPGIILADVKLVYTDGQISSNKFSFICRYDPLHDKSFEAGPYISKLEQIYAEAQAQADYLRALIEMLQIDISGTPVMRSDLHNTRDAVAAGLKAIDANMAQNILLKSDVTHQNESDANKIVAADSLYSIKANLQSQIDTTNSNLTVSKVTYSWGFLFKYGKLRTLEILGAITLESGAALLTLAAADSPNNTMFAPMIYGTTYNLGLIRIGTDGAVTLRDNSDTTPAWPSTFFRGQITWYVS